MTFRMVRSIIIVAHLVLTSNKICVLSMLSMLKIRLQRIGRHKEPHYRVVCINATKGPKSSDYIEILGSYNPKMGTTELKGDRITYWLSVGAQASDTVHNFLVKNNIIEAPKRAVNINKKRKSK